LAFSIDQITELLALRVEPQQKCMDVRIRAKAKIANIEQK
jgi:hypothetical protein